MKILIINETCGVGSHGKICVDIAKKYEAEGHIVKIAFGRFFSSKKKYRNLAIKIGNVFSVFLHVFITRLFDKHGLGSKYSTKRFIKWANIFDPDVLWLHNIHGYYINYKLLFNWIKSRPSMKVKWTLHDCWAFTGHCSHFTYEKCDKWVTGCHNPCPCKKEYPSSLLICNAKKNFYAKKQSFMGVVNMELITPSKWLKELVEKSFLGSYPINVVKNKIDIDVFKPIENNFKSEYKLNDKFMILAAANVWTKKKGLLDIIELANKLDNKKYAVVIIGKIKKRVKASGKNILVLKRTNSKENMAKLFSAADVFVNPTYEDNYPTVNLESEACGTPVITYDTGGCKETISSSSFAVETGNIDKIIEIIKGLSKK